jgi:allantoinase
VPYTLDTNDMRFATPQGFNTADHFFTYLRDAFDVLYEEGETAPKMLSIGMHCRLLGRPGRVRALQRFLDYLEKHDRVWITRRIDIANHWVQEHPYQSSEANRAARLGSASDGPGTPGSPGMTAAGVPLGRSAG